MILTRSVDTAMRLLVYLAQPEAEGRYSNARQIERELRIPPFALRRTLWALTRGGLLRSAPGRGGGFRLRRRPRDISLAEVMAAVEGPIVAYPCRGVDADCEQSGRCTVAPVYKVLEQRLHELFSDYSLRDCLPPLERTSAVGGRHA